MAGEPAGGGWVQDTMGDWTRELHGLDLRVMPGSGDADEPWTWEVLEPAGGGSMAGYEIGQGRAETRDAAMARAEAAARAYHQQPNR
jgi:hypothetical protein